jgi:Cys-tRNA(Pro)/Cys-tRNA(Cys) deacylase
MMASVKGGTPAIAALQRAEVAFAVHEFAHQPGTTNYGLAAAAALGAEPNRVFKTLVALVDDRPAVGIVPVTCSLALKPLAAAVGGKRAEMCPVDRAERLTGYVAGGISPFGQKRLLPTVLDETADLFDTIFVSGGKRGLDVELSPASLVAVLEAVVADICA